MASRSTASSGSGAKRVVVVGGNGYVGSHICEELVARKHAGQEPQLEVVSLSRSGLPPTSQPSWAGEVQWLRGDPLQAERAPESEAAQGVQRALTGSAAVISCVGGFGNAEAMRRINGATNVAAMSAAKAAGVPRFVFISAHHYVLPNFLQRGYFEGKFQAEQALQDKFAGQGVQIRPSFIFGTRQVGSVGVPLWLVGTPLQMLTSFSLVRKLTTLPLLGPVLAPLLTPPVSVQAVARAAVDAALREGAPHKTIVDVDDLLEYEA